MVFTWTAPSMNFAKLNLRNEASLMWDTLTGKSLESLHVLKFYDLKSKETRRIFMERDETTINICIALTWN